MALARCNLVIQDEDGNIVNGASIEVRREEPGLPLLSVPYSDRDGLSSLGNPYTAADGADAGFYAVQGSYKITATLGSLTRVWRNVPVGLQQEEDSVSADEVSYDDGEDPAVITNVQGALDEIFENGGGVVGAYTPQQFGALADGTTDDYQAFVDAVAAAVAAGHCSVYVPPATYVLSQRLVITDNNVCIYASSRRTTIIKRRAGATLANLIHVGPTSGDNLVTGVRLEGIWFDGNGSCSDAAVKFRNSSLCDVSSIRVSNATGDGIKSDTATTSVNTKTVHNTYFDIEADGNANGMRFIGEKESQYDQLWSHNNTDCGIIFRAFEYDGGTLTETTQCTIGQMHADDNTNDGIVFDGVEKFMVGIALSTQNLGWGIRFRSSDVSGLGVANNGVNIAAASMRGNVLGGIKAGDSVNMNGAHFGSVTIIGGGGAAGETGIHLEAVSNVMFESVLISLMAGPGIHIKEGTPLGGAATPSGVIQFGMVRLNFNGQVNTGTIHSLWIEDGTTEVSINSLISQGQNTTGSNYEVSVEVGCADIVIGHASLTSASGSNGVDGTVNFTGRYELEGVEQTLGGSGDVVGPGSSTDAACALFDSTTGKLLQMPGSDTDRAAARVSIAAASSDALASVSAAVNGFVNISQERGTTGLTLTNNTNAYTADMWEAMYNHGAATAVVTSGQVAAASFPSTNVGYSFGHQVKATTAITSPANGDFARHRHQIEGYRVSHYGWGAAGALSVAVCFKWYSTGAGVAFVRISNSAANRAYHREVTLAAGWNSVREVIPGDTSGTWEKTTSAGMIIDMFASGKAASPATPNAWSATPATQTTNSVNLLDTNNDTSIVTGLVVLPVLSTSELITADRMQMLQRSYAAELLECHRYFWRVPVTGNTQPTGFLGGCESTSAASFIAIFPVQMRTTPTMAVSDQTHFGVVPAGFGSNTPGTGLALVGQHAPGKTTRVQLTGGSGFTAGTIAFLYSANASATMDFNARL